jgi:hypothetical protein
MTLIFGNLVQSFVSFGTTIAEAKAGDSNAQLKLPVVAAAFRHAAAGDAAILAYIGRLILMRQVVECFPINHRRRRVCLHLHVYVHMGAYR